MFSLRFRSERLRELVREVAEREGVSQNELLEVAAEHEVIARGALLADHLDLSAARLRSISERAFAGVVTASIDAFVAGEANSEPLRPRRISRPATQPERSARRPLGAVAAFHSTG